MVVVLEDGGQAAEEQLKAFCEGKLARYKVPKNVVFADELPYSAYGKVEKAKLRESYLSD